MSYDIKENYYLKYLKYKQKYIELNDNDLKGGMFSGWFGSSKPIVPKVLSSTISVVPTSNVLSSSTPVVPTSNVDITDKVSLDSIYESLCERSFFYLFYRDFPQVILDYIKETSNKQSLIGGSSKPSSTDTIIPGILVSNIDIENKKLVLWEISKELYKKIYKLYPDLDYKNRSKNLKNYIITEIISRVFKTEAKKTAKLDLLHILKIFKYIGFYIFLKIYKILHIQGNTQFKYINNNYISLEDNEETIKIQLLDKISKLILLFENKMRSGNISNNKETSSSELVQILEELKLKGIKDSTAEQFNILMLNNLNTLSTTTIISYIGIEELYFLDTIIALTITNILYNSKKSLIQT
jgi:hypothetical protein